MEARLRGGKETARGFDEIAEAQKRAGRQTDEMSSKGGRLSGILDKLGSGAKGFIAGFVGIAAIERALSAIIGHMQRILDLRREITQEGLDLRQTFLPLASQLGDTSRQGISRAVDIGSRFFKAGVTSEEASQLAIAVDIGLPGGLRGPQREQNIELGIKLASVGKSAGFTSAAFAPLFKALTSAGAAGSEQDALRFLGQGIAAQQASPSQDPGAFFTAFQANTAALLGEGVSQELLLQLFVQGVTGRGGETLGGQGLKKLAETLKLPETEKGFAKLGFPIAGKSVEERLRIANQVLPPLTLEQKREFINPERLSIIDPLFTSASLAAGEKARVDIEKIEAEDVERRAEDFQRTNLALRTRSESETLQRREKGTRFKSVEVRLSGVAEKILEERLESGEVSGLEDFLLFDQAQEDEIFLEQARKIAAEHGTTIEEQLRSRGRGDLLGPFGRIPRGPVRGLGEERRAAIGRAIQSLEAQPNTTIINNNIGMQLILDPTRPDTTGRSGQFDPGGAQ